jgi:hypothetical protein
VLALLTVAAGWLPRIACPRSLHSAPTPRIGGSRSGGSSPRPCRATVAAGPGQGILAALAAIAATFCSPRLARRASCSPARGARAAAVAAAIRPPVPACDVPMKVAGVAGAALVLARAANPSISWTATTASPGDAVCGFGAYGLAAANAGAPAGPGRAHRACSSRSNLPRTMFMETSAPFRRDPAATAGLLRRA